MSRLQGIAFRPAGSLDRPLDRPDTPNVDADLTAWFASAGSEFLQEPSTYGYGLGLHFDQPESPSESSSPEPDRSMPGSPSLSSSGSDVSDPQVATPPAYVAADPTASTVGAGPGAVGAGYLDLPHVDLATLYMALGEQDRADAEKAAASRRAPASFPYLSAAAPVSQVPSAALTAGQQAQAHVGPHNVGLNLSNPFQGIPPSVSATGSQDMAALASFLPAAPSSAAPAGVAATQYYYSVPTGSFSYPAAGMTAPAGQSGVAYAGVPAAYQAPYGSVPVNYPGYPVGTYGFHPAYAAYHSGAYPTATAPAYAQLQASQTNASTPYGGADSGASSMMGSTGPRGASIVARKSRDKDKEKRYNCPDCGKPFARAFNLQTHVATHRGIKPFDCPAPDCGKSFSRRHDLGRHLQAVHEPWLVGTGQTAQGAAAPVKKRGHFRLKVSPVEGPDGSTSIQMTEALSPAPSVGSQSSTSSTTRGKASGHRSSRTSIASASGSVSGTDLDVHRQQQQHQHEQEQAHQQTPAAAAAAAAAYFAATAFGRSDPSSSAQQMTMFPSSHFG